MRKKISAKRRYSIYQKGDGRCYVCGRLVGLSFEVDHIVAHAKGGACEDGNFELICGDCNLIKKDKGIHHAVYIRYIRGNDKIMMSIKNNAPEFDAPEMFGEKIEYNEIGFISLTKFSKSVNADRAINGKSPWNYKAYLQSKTTKKFTSELKERYGEIYIPARGRGQQTWIHPLLFVDLAINAAPSLNVQSYDWMISHITDSYTELSPKDKMVGALYSRWQNRTTFQSFLESVVSDISSRCKGEVDSVYLEVASLCSVMTDPSIAVRVAIARHIEKNTEVKQ
ncbi:HNH endonuclease [Vibrio phage 1.134.O._10N.222.52.B8]|nr:HNH endonuclease [Vibrio phage 1.134.O._10N.222.52.B8]